MKRMCILNQRNLLGIYVIFVRVIWYEDSRKSKYHSSVEFDIKHSQNEVLT
jgi:hypothetical protein